MNDRGFNVVGAEKGKGSVEDGIEFIRSFDKVIIHPRCKNTIFEFQNYKYKVDARSGQITNKIVDKYNHHVDACFSEDTLVEVNGKIMRFDEIPKEGVIKGFNGESVKYFNGGFIRYDKLCTIKLENGIIIKATPDHKFLTSDGEWVAAINLKGKKLCKSSLFQIPSKSLTEKSIINTKARGISQEETKDYIELFGSILMAKLNMASTFITKTIMLPIMILKILIKSTRANIKAITPKNFTKLIQILQKNRWKKIKTNAGNGTKASKANNGIKNITKRWLINYMRKRRKVVNNVELVSLVIKGENTYFVATSANQNGEETAASMMSKKDVSYVAKCLSQTNTQKSELVEVENVNMLSGIYKTYCVTIPNNECFSLANDIVVSNCRYALSPLMKNHTVDYGAII